VGSIDDGHITRQRGNNMKTRNLEDVRGMLHCGHRTGIKVLEYVGAERKGGQHITTASVADLEYALEIIKQQMKEGKSKAAVEAARKRKAQAPDPAPVSLEFNEQHATTDHPYIGLKCIVRCFSDGVHFGTVRSINAETGEIRLTNSRRLWKWHSKFVLEELAMHGLASSNVKIGETIPDSISYEVIRLLPCSEAAIKSIEDAPKANR
jgi:hypothetical protein